MKKRGRDKRDAMERRRNGKERENERVINEDNSNIQILYAHIDRDVAKYIYRELKRWIHSTEMERHI